jgi:two-component system chemotaxis response regulator CheY
MRALVVDNSRAMRDLIRDFLNRARFQVLATDDAQEALKILERIGPVDLVLVNWDLPKRDALPFVRVIRGRSEYAAMRLIMVTAGVDASQVIQAVRAGVDECLVRPFTRNMLLEKIALLHLSRD